MTNNEVIQLLKEMKMDYLRPSLHDPKKLNKAEAIEYAMFVILTLEDDKK